MTIFPEVIYSSVKKVEQKMNSAERAVRRLSLGIKAEEKEAVFEYFDTPKKDRLSQKQFIKESGIFRPAFYRIKQIYAIEKAIEVEDKIAKLKESEEKEKVIRGIQEATFAGLGFDEEDPEAWWRKRERTLEVNQAILASAKKGNAQSQKLAKQLAGELIEKTEVKIGLSADELTRRQLEAERQLREGGFIGRGDEYRMVEMSKELSLLPDALRLDSEP